MGYYIQVPDNLNKAMQLVNIHNAEIIPCPESFSDVPDNLGLVCVVENPGFDAAAYCYSQSEFAEFTREDGRIKLWLVMNKEKAEKLSGYAAYGRVSA